jgi:hypothetical protein
LFRKWRRIHRIDDRVGFGQPQKAQAATSVVTKGQGVWMGAATDGFVGLVAGSREVSVW